MKIQIHHTTNYHYEEPVKKSIQVLRITPQTLAHQRVLSWQLTLPRISAEMFDGFGNYCTVLNLNQPHQSLHVQAQGWVEIDDDSDYNTDAYMPPTVFLNRTWLTRSDEALADFAEIQTGGRADRQGLTSLSRAILDHMPYIPGTTGVSTTARQAFALGSGVCQDHTHVFLACARSLGIPARYVSGYLVSDDSDHLASHAWAEAWLDGHWYVFDITNQLFRPSHHVQLAVGRDYNDTAPIRGMRQGGGMERMDFLVQVREAQQ
ncbi:transglutaminase family protein [Uruburuella testudinis]|uniref:Transglutaminase family protein n=1 Tax=Uruburuella testudinis TaxID=1282863 RepID=A0ABY4DZ86_9NEIS|nr:transglutaminase family protein [Uruburuella testudinis]UOO82011.1 transglutaminase family protein [Uruburuella testudinis]